MKRAVDDTLAIRRLVAAHLSVADSVVGRDLRIRKDSAWVWIDHDSITATLVRVERQRGRWVFVREVLSSVR